MKKPPQKTGKIGSLAINQTMLLVLAVVVLVVLAVFYIFLGGRASDIIDRALKFPILGEE
ncbi:MAG: hypothetical protein U9Q92_04460 [archaeon]|nr:hypothetical protein [archaeon]